MKSRYIVALTLLALVGALALCSLDLPQTTYDEADNPVVMWKSALPTQPELVTILHARLAPARPRVANRLGVVPHSRLHGTKPLLAVLCIQLR